MKNIAGVEEGLEAFETMSLGQSNGQLYIDQWRDLLRLRMASTSMIIDHDPNDENSDAILTLLSRIAEVEQRFTALATRQRAKSIEEISFKLAHWIMDKELHNPRAHPQDQSDQLVLSAFQDLVDIYPDEELQKLAPN